MGGTHGTEQLKKVLDVLIEGGMVADRMLSESGGWLKRLSHLTAVADEVFALTGLDTAALKAEWGELDEGDRSSLVAHFKAKFDLPDDQVEAKVEAGLSLAAKAGELVLEVIDFSKTLKASE